MSPVLSIGPLALATDRLLAVAGIWLFVAIGSNRRFFGDHVRTIGWAAIAGLVAARLFYVIAHWADFARDPLAIVKVWQGGFSPLAGMVATALIIALGARSHDRWRLLALLLVMASSWYVVDRLTATSVQSPMTLAGVDLKTLDGRPFNPASLTGKPYVLNLWADWCPPCRREMPLLAEAARANPGVTFLFANQGDPAEVARKLPSQHGIDPRTIVLDSGARLSAGYGGALPTTLFVDSNGSVRSVHSGEIGRAALSEKTSLIKENNP